MRLNIILFSGQSIDSLSTNQLLLLSHRTRLILVFVVELCRSQIEICKYAMIEAMIGFTISGTTPPRTRPVTRRARCRPPRWRSARRRSPFGTTVTRSTRRAPERARPSCTGRPPADCSSSATVRQREPSRSGARRGGSATCSAADLRRRASRVSRARCRAAGWRPPGSTIRLRVSPSGWQSSLRAESSRRAR